MRPLGATIVVVALLVLVAAAPAGAAFNVEYNPATGVTGTAITINEDTTAEADVVALQQNGDGTFTVTRTGGGITSATCTPALPASVVCPAPAAQSFSIDLGGGNDRLTQTGVTIPIAVAGGAGNDELNGGGGDDVLAGGDDTDTLVGGPGRDEYFGEGGGDVIVSRDGIAERIACGAGDDRVDNDFTDIIAECERGTDNDGDGFSTAVDCNDAVAGIFPGAPDALENGVDEDCDGQDDRNLDRDGDTFPVPLDCNDADPKIRPGTVEIRGNKVDENCDQRALPFAPLASLISTRWQITSDVTRLRKLIVRNAPAGARIAVTCDGPGCTFGKRKTVRVKRDLAPVRLHPFFGKGRLRPGARVVVRITAPGMIGLSYRYKIERNVLPAAKIKCLAPGSNKVRSC